MGFFFDKDIGTDIIDSKSKRKIIAEGEELTSSHLYAEAGSVFTEKRKPYSGIAVILSGQFEFTLDGDTALLSAGDSVYIPPDVPYSFVCLGKGEVITVINNGRLQ